MAEIESTLSIAISPAQSRLCLDFANTAHWHASNQPEEQIPDYTSLVAWAVAHRLLTPAEATELQETAAVWPDQAAEAHAVAIDLRESIYAVLTAYTHASPIPAAPLATLNAAHAVAMSNAEVIHDPTGFHWRWLTAEPALDSMLWPVVRSALQLLTTPELLGRVGECADDRGCGYLFLDLSRNRSRRWCDINECGNRAKQRRHYHRRK
jgi:predicted RNA-binding Zn ribbon-like protein